MSVLGGSGSSARDSGKKERPEKLGILTLWREDVMCVFKRDPAARSVMEVLTTYPGVHAVLIYRVSARLWRRKWRFGARMLSFLARFISNVDIHPGATIGRRFFIDHGACVVIGETAEIGNDVTIYHGVTLGGTTWNQGKRHPTLDDGVLVGTGAKILGPVRVGRDARVGANSVVVNDVPRGGTVVGIPARLVIMKKEGQEVAHGINLNHHLIPDPVGKAISCLLDRIDSLENQLKTLAVPNQGRFELQNPCEPDNEFCVNDCAIGSLNKEDFPGGSARI